ncbi:MAG: TonB-dependent receptor, partial [Chitinophagaceae bacterium]
MRKVYCLLLISLVYCAAHAQKNGTVKGVAYDTLAKRAIPDATITVLAKKDSSLVSFGMTDDAGRFSFTDLAVGEYRLLITHVSYHNINKFFAITEADKSPNLGNISMNDKSKVLDEVIVTNEAPPVTLIGDTVQYNA